MKDKIHPKYVDTEIICSCGTKFKTKSVQPELRIEVCSACHPFYTGQKRLVDTAGRVDRFKERMEKSKQMQSTKKKAKKPAKKEAKPASKKETKEKKKAVKKTKKKAAKK
jgi:large subunit ribosomal protein L31